MLNLIYYDIKATYKRIIAMIVILVIFACGVRFLWGDTFMSFFGNTDFYIGDVIKYLFAGLLIAFCGISLLMIIFVQSKWYDANILSPQGQLTNMLPVSSFEIVLSKIFVAFLWNTLLTVSLVGVCSVFLAGTKLFSDMLQIVSDISIQNNIHISFSKIVISICVYVVLTLTDLSALCYLSQTFGQMFNTFRNLMLFVGFIMFFAIALLIQLNILMLLGINNVGAIFESRNLTDIINYVISTVNKLSVTTGVVTVIYWISTSLILKNHLNML